MFGLSPKKTMLEAKTMYTRVHKRRKLFGINNPMWKGDAVGYHCLHLWVKRQIKKPEKCQKCLEQKKLDLANISGKYERNLKDWSWLCRRCHMLSDGRMKNLLRGGQRGEKCSKSKLKAEDVILIRELAKSGVSMKELSRKFSLGVTQPYKIINRQAWAHI